MLKFSLAARLRGHKQRKLKGHVIHFFCLCPLGLTIKLNFDISTVAYCSSNCYYNFNLCGIFEKMTSATKIRTRKINGGRKYASSNVRYRLKFRKISRKDLLCTKM